MVPGLDLCGDGVPAVPRRPVDAAALALLLDRVRAVETRAWSAGRDARVSTASTCGESAAPRPAAPAVDLGWPGANDVLLCGQTHEWLCAPPHGEPAPGSAWAPQSGHAGWAPPLAALVHAAWAVVDSLPAGSGRLVVWVGRRAWPTVHALVRPDRHGPGDGRRLLLRSVFVDAADVGAVVWTADMALRCPGVAALVADVSGIDMAQSRRLQLAAAAGADGVALDQEGEPDARGPVGLLARPGRERGEISAAATRWFVSPLASSSHAPRWCVRLLRRKGCGVAVASSPVSSPSAAAGGAAAWTLELRRASLCVCAPSALVDGSVEATPGTHGLRAG